jgi:hypothetical protein
MGTHSRKTPPAFLLTLLLLSPVYTRGQAVRQDDVFAPVPASERARLVERLNLFFDYRRTNQRNKLYELLADTGGESKEQFVLSGQGTRKPGDGFVGLNIQSVTFIEKDGRWAIFGCGEWLRKGHAERSPSAIYATLKDGEWYFSDIMMTVLCQGDPGPCAQQKP